MTDVETLAERVQTVERAVTDGDHEFPEATDLAELADRVAAVERRLAELDDRTTDLEAATQALRGYVGNVRSVDDDVAQRADAALAATDRLERRLDDALDDRPEGATNGHHSGAAESTAVGGAPLTPGHGGVSSHERSSGTGARKGGTDRNEGAGGTTGVLGRIRALL